jgi:hypothetical protein
MSEAEEKPLPAVCVVCAGAGPLESVVVKKVFIPIWVWFLLPLGVLPAALVSLAVQTKHSFTVQLCQRCSGRRQWAGVVHWLAMLACLVLFFVAIWIGVMNRSWLAFLIGIGVMVAVAAAASRFDQSVNPRYSKFADKRVEIEVPGHGRYVVIPPYYLLPSKPGA